jgi:hypothetical protein
MTSSRRWRQCFEIEECFVKYVSEFSVECETVRCLDADNYNGAGVEIGLENNHLIRSKDKKYQALYLSHPVASYV